MLTAALSIPRLPPRVLKRPASKTNTKVIKSPKDEKHLRIAAATSVVAQPRRLLFKQPQPLMCPSEEMLLNMPTFALDKDAALEAAEAILHGEPEVPAMAMKAMKASTCKVRKGRQMVDIGGPIHDHVISLQDGWQKRLRRYACGRVQSTYFSPDGDRYSSLRLARGVGGYKGQ